MSDDKDDIVEDEDDSQGFVMTRDDCNALLIEMEQRMGPVEPMPDTLTVEDALEIVQWEHGNPLPGPMRRARGGPPRFPGSEAPKPE